MLQADVMSGVTVEGFEAQRSAQKLRSSVSDSKFRFGALGGSSH